MSFSHFLSDDDHLCVGFSQALGTSVNSHPLSLLSSAHNLLQQKYAAVCLIVCACASVRSIAVIYAQATQCGLKVNDSSEVRGRGGDGYNVAKISREPLSAVQSLWSLLWHLWFQLCDSNVSPYAFYQNRLSPVCLFLYSEPTASLGEWQ